MKTLIALASFLFAALCTLQAEQVPQSAIAVQPLRLGDPVPEVVLHTAEDTHFNLREEVMAQPSVILFYRGGWCPYCNRHLAAIQQVEEKLLSMGYRILAVSPDRPAKLAATAEKNEVSYLLLSDSSMEAARAFGIAFKLDEVTVKKYKDEYAIDIEADSGQSHHQLPVPAVFIANANGRIIFTHFNPDYKKRLDAKVLIDMVDMLD